MYIKAWRVLSTAMNSSVIISALSSHSTSYLFSILLNMKGHKTPCDKMNYISCDLMMAAVIVSVLMNKKKKKRKKGRL